MRVRWSPDDDSHAAVEWTWLGIMDSVDIIQMEHFLVVPSRTGLCMESSSVSPAHRLA